MSLFFDADWFDAKLGERGLDRASLAIAAGLDRADLHGVFTNERVATAAELNAFATCLGVDLVEVTLRSGVAEREASQTDTEGRIESIEARLNEIDNWLAEFERAQKKSA